VKSAEEATAWTSTTMRKSPVRTLEALDDMSDALIAPFITTGSLYK